MLQIEYLKNPGADAYTKYILTTLKLTLSYLLTLLLGYLLTWETKLSCNEDSLAEIAINWILTDHTTTTTGEV